MNASAEMDWNPADEFIGPDPEDELRAGDPCPNCFESSGYMARHVSATWEDPSYDEADRSNPCPICDGTGILPEIKPAAPMRNQPDDDIAF